METLENLILAFFLRKVVDSRDPLLPRRQWLRFLFPQEIFLLAQSLETSPIPIICRRRRCRTKEEWFLLDSLCEKLIRGVG
jgi:hypothetical protein